MQLLTEFLVRKCWLEATTVYYSITPPVLVKAQFSTLMMEHLDMEGMMMGMTLYFLWAMHLLEVVPLFFAEINKGDEIYCHYQYL
jgi:hypothetical protein